MTANDDELRAGVAELVQETRRGTASRHAEIEELADYLDGSLDDQRSLGVREHLLDCPACTDRLLDLEALRSAEQRGPEEGDDPTWDLARAESWERIRASLPPEIPPAPELAMERQSVRRRQPVAWHWPALLAAGGLLLFKLLRRLWRKRGDR